MNPNSEKDIEKLQWIHDWQYKEVMYRRDHAFRSVSYTHLDVYKRQVYHWAFT